MPECESCGRALTDAHVFCPRCGTPTKKGAARADDAATTKAEAVAGAAAGAVAKTEATADTAVKVASAADTAATMVKSAGTVAAATAAAAVGTVADAAKAAPATEPAAKAPQPTTAASASMPEPPKSTPAAPAAAAAAVPAATPAATIACPKCGTQLPAGARFCGTCGSSLPGTPATATTPAASAPAAAPRAAQPASAAATAPRAATPTAGTVQPRAAAHTLEEPETAQWGYGDEVYDPRSWEDTHSDRRYPPAGAYGAYRGPSLAGEYLSFRRFLMPGIAQVVFWLLEVLNLIYWVHYIVENHRSMWDGGTSAWNIIYGVVGLLVGAVIVRVVVELAIVLFNLDARTSAIEKKLDDR
jgi:hypothetical protein